MWSISQQPHHPLLIPGTSQTSKPLITSPQACRIPARLTIHASIPSFLSLQVLQATVSPACLSPNQHPTLPSSSEPLHPARNPAPRERAFLISDTFCQRFTQPQSCVFHQINAPPEDCAWHCGFAADSGVLIRLQRQSGDRVFKHEA